MTFDFEVADRHSGGHVEEGAVDGGQRVGSLREVGDGGHHRVGHESEAGGGPFGYFNNAEVLVGVEYLVVLEVVVAVEEAVEGVGLPFGVDKGHRVGTQMVVLGLAVGDGQKDEEEGKDLLVFQCVNVD